MSCHITSSNAPVCYKKDCVILSLQIRNFMLWGPRFSVFVVPSFNSLHCELKIQCVSGHFIHVVSPFFIMYRNLTLRLIVEFNWVCGVYRTKTFECSEYSNIFCFYAFFRCHPLSMQYYNILLLPVFQPIVCVIWDICFLGVILSKCLCFAYGRITTQ